MTTLNSEFEGGKSYEEENHHHSININARIIINHSGLRCGMWLINTVLEGES